MTREERRKAMLGIFAFEPLEWKAWMAFSILVITLSLVITNALPTAVSMLLGLTAMLVFKIFTPQEATEGFANTDGIQRTSVLLPVFRVLLGKLKYLLEAKLRVKVPVALISSFLNNNPVVAMLIPVIQSWSSRANSRASKLLMRLNNAAIPGGTLTLLGTSTNLVVDVLAKQTALLGTDENGEPIGLSIFGITPVGAVQLGAGLLYMVIFSRFLLRDRGQTGVGAIIRNPREYTVALLVQERSSIVGDTVQEAGL